MKQLVDFIENYLFSARGKKNIFNFVVAEQCFDFRSRYVVDFTGI
jgi:hypothetical protein